MKRQTVREELLQVNMDLMKFLADPKGKVPQLSNSARRRYRGLYFCRGFPLLGKPSHQAMLLLYIMTDFERQAVMEYMTKHLGVRPERSLRAV